MKKILSFIMLLVVSLSSSGCLQVNTGNNQAVLPDGGMFFSENGGRDWQQRTEILSTNGERNTFSLDRVASIEQDPNDPKTLYFGTVGQGMFYSYDRGMSWQLAYDLGPGTVWSIAVDPVDKCTVYVAIRNKLYKTEDCSRTWEEVYTDSAADVFVRVVEVDHFNNQNIYMALSRGDIVKSTDAGKSWRTIYRFEKEARKFYIDPSDSRRMYVEIKRNGLYKSNDSGQSWESMESVFEELELDGDVVDIELNKENPDLIFIATEEGIAKSTDKGVKWEKLSLVPPEEDALITSMVVNPKETNEIFYVTARTIHKSSDGGSNWAPRVLPGTRIARILLMDLEDTSLMYLGFGEVR